MLRILLLEDESSRSKNDQRFRAEGRPVAQKGTCPGGESSRANPLKLIKRSNGCETRTRGLFRAFEEAGLFQMVGKRASHLSWGWVSRSRY